MDRKHKNILNKINKLINDHGIPHYVKNWKKFRMKNNYKNDIDFINDLAEYVGSYHEHSGIIYKDNYIPTKKQIDEIKTEKKPNPKYTKKRTMPTFSFSSDKIGKIVFYQFIGINKKDQDRLVKLVKRNLIKWEKNGLKGLILDFRHHYGGNVFPLYYAFSDIFNNSTIYGWYNKKAKKNDNIWVNIKNKKLNYGVFMNDKLNFHHPIAIIIGHDTISSGEFGALMFYGRKNVKIFGKPSGGYLSGNVMKSINKNITFKFTTSLVNTVDGTFHIKEQIFPDKKTDKPITESRKWIKNHPLNKT